MKKIVVDSIRKEGPEKDADGNEVPKKETKYFKTDPDGNWINSDIGEDQFYDIKDAINENRSFWGKIKDGVKNAIKTFINKVAAAINALVEKVKEWFGFYVGVTMEYITVVEKGAAFEYRTEQYYNLGVEQYECEKPNVQDVHPDETFPKTYGPQEISWEDEVPCEWDDEGKPTKWKTVKNKEWEMALKVESYVQYNEIHKIVQNTLVPTADCKMEPYEELNRYNWVLARIDEDEKDDSKNGTNDNVVSAEDSALALDMIIAYYSSSFGLVAGAVASDFDPAGPLNESVVKYASQFENKRLAYMRKIDDTGIFFDNHWCAMFVSFVMKKAGVPIKSFTGCSSFWSKYNKYPGFYDIRNTNNGGYITKDSSHIAANHNLIRPGDILLFRWYGGSSAARHHTGICHSVETSGGNVVAIYVIEGNTGSSNYFNSKVSIRKYEGDAMKQIVSFVSINQVKANPW